MKGVYVIILVATVTLFSLTTADDDLEVEAPSGKLISTFQIVRFPNDPCSGTAGTRNGTCYTSAECSDKGGASAGSCADGFGVCCTFVITSCGQSSAENITYWDAPATVCAGCSCDLNINAINDNICQLRLDFLTFIITGPSTQTISEVNMQFSAPLISAEPLNTGSAWTTNCLTDTFSVSSPNFANKPPVLCGINSGMHMYVDMDSDVTNVLSFVFQTISGPAAIAGATSTRGIGAIAARDWDITVLQYECGYVNSAPPGCTQYLWADTGLQVAGWILSYNFQAAGTKHLANQNQKVCIRRERTICWASFYLLAAGTYNIAGRSAGAALHPNNYGVSGVPCGFQCEGGVGITDADTNCAYDCIIIPGSFVVANAADGLVIAVPNAAQVQARTAAATNHSPAPPQTGGAVNFGYPANVAFDALAVANVWNVDGEATATSVFTQHVPFQLTFKSDGHEGAGTDSEHFNLVGSIGLKLSYDLIPCA